MAMRSNRARDTSVCLPPALLPLSLPERRDRSMYFALVHMSSNLILGIIVIVGGIEVVIGITMLKVNRGHEIEVYYALNQMNGIKEIYRILGEYSIFVIIKAKDQFSWITSSMISEVPPK